LGGEAIHALIIADPTLERAFGIGSESSWDLAPPRLVEVDYEQQGVEG